LFIAQILHLQGLRAPAWSTVFKLNVTSRVPVAILASNNFRQGYCSVRVRRTVCTSSEGVGEKAFNNKQGTHRAHPEAGK
jgi:hypothetical protein